MDDPQQYLDPLVLAKVRGLEQAPRGEPMGTEARQRPGWGSRLLAVGCFLGLAPALAPLVRRRRDPYLTQQYARALATVVLLLLAVALILTVVVVGTVVVVYRSDLLRLVGDGESINRWGHGLYLPLALWALVWLFGVVRAL